MSSRRTALFDSSAILSVAFGQQGSAGVIALATDLAERGIALAASRLAEVECHRAALRVAQLNGDDDYDHAAIAQIVAMFDLIEIGALVVRQAIGLRPFLKTLDSIHLGTALALGHELEGLVTADQQMSAVARANGIALLLQ